MLHACSRNGRRHPGPQSLDPDPVEDERLGEQIVLDHRRHRLPPQEHFAYRLVGRAGAVGVEVLGEQHGLGGVELHGRAPLRELDHQKTVTRAWMRHRDILASAGEKVNARAAHHTGPGAAVGQPSRL